MLDTKVIKDNEIKERTRELIKSRGGNTSAFAREIEISAPYLGSILNSSDKGVPATLIKALCKIEVNINWLLTGKGEVYQNGGLLERAEKAESEVLELQSDLSKIKYHAQELREMWKDEIKKGNNK
tara:strand:+ start:881 stop:1258 length:378 start_codon:yes stop_codon:yes gene_type:complete